MKTRRREREREKEREREREREREGERENTSDIVLPLSDTVAASDIYSWQPRGQWLCVRVRMSCLFAVMSAIILNPDDACLPTATEAVNNLPCNCYLRKNNITAHLEGTKLSRPSAKARSSKALAECT